MIRAENMTQWETAKDGHKYHPARVFTSEYLEKYDNFKNSYFKDYGNITPIPCGQCIECRLEKSRSWATRGYLESLYHKNNWFVTITYDKDHLPKVDEITTSEGITYTELPEYEWRGCLVKKDLQDFKKRLLKYMADHKIQSEGIRFMACGEYGDKERRPHYHLILLNCNLPTESFYNPRLDWEKNYHWQNTIIEKCWSDPGVKGKPGKQKGIIEVCEANWNTIAYVARYITKKQYGPSKEDYYAKKGQTPEFFLCSTRPGIGRQYYEDHKEEIYSLDRILIKNANGNVWVNPPKYFDDLYENEEPEKMAIIKEKRKKHMLEQMQIKDKSTSLSRWEQNQVELRTIEQKNKALIRPL